MNVQIQGPGGTPAAIHIPTGRYAFSRGMPMATNGLMGCMAVVVHDPVGRCGCLGHAEPARDMSTFLARCIHLIGASDADCGNLEVVFAGGNRGPTFVTDVATALNDNLLSAINCYDGRRGVTAPYVGQSIAPAFSLTYDPSTATVYVGTSPLTLPTYTHAVTQEVLTVGLGMFMITSPALG